MKSSIFPISLFMCLAGWIFFASPASAANIVIGRSAEPSTANFFLTSRYSNDAACIQAALNSVQNGDTVTVRAGTYNLSTGITTTGKSFTFIGEGSVTFNVTFRGSVYPAFYFHGSNVSAPAVTANAAKGSSQVTLSNAANIQAGDLFKIWKNVQWCPLDYPDQPTGEMYMVTSVSGNTLILNEPLLRDYNLSEGVSSEVYRPVEVHVSNIRIQDNSATTERQGLRLEFCKNSSVNDSWFSDSGLQAVSFYSCFFAEAKNNEIHNCIRPGSGYGVGVYNASAYVNVENNFIQNCRHAVTGNESERKALVRNVYIANNTMYGASIPGSMVVDAHNVVINYTVVQNKIYPTDNFFAFNDGTESSIFADNEIHGGLGAVNIRGDLNETVHEIRNNHIYGNSSSLTYRGAGTGIGDRIVITNNIQEGGVSGVSIVGSGTYGNIQINGNTFRNLSYRGIDLRYAINGTNVSIFDNTLESIGRGAITINSNSHTNGITNIQNNTIVNVSTAGSSPAIEIDGIRNAAICNNNISDSTGRTTYGIFEGAGSDYTSASGNIITGMSLGTVHFIGSHSGTSGTCPELQTNNIPHDYWYWGSGSSGGSGSTTPTPSYWHPTVSILDANPFVYTDPALPVAERDIEAIFPALGSSPNTATDSCITGDQAAGTAGLIPCGRHFNDPATVWDECEPCKLCHLVLLGQLVIEFMVRIAVVAATVAIIIAGLLYIFASGRTDLISKAKSGIKYTLIGFIIVFAAWAMVNTILIITGYISPMGGTWHMMC